MLNFDLQLFGEEVLENSVETQTEETSQAELPEGFEGLEEFKEDILKEISESKKVPEEPAEKSEAAEEKISYKEFKQKIDEVNDLKAQIDELKKTKESLPPANDKSSQIPKQRQPILQQTTQIQMPQIQITPEFIKAVESATKNLAMQMVGMTPEKVEQLEYAEEGDADLERWKYAKQYAAQTVHNEIQKIRTQQTQQAQEFLNRHNDAVQSYNEFAAREMKSPEFKEIVGFATGDYFNSLSENKQKVIADSYVRIERQTASPAEVMLIQNFYEKAKTAYQNRKNARRVNNRNPQPKNKLPKIDQVNGASGNYSEGFTTGDLERIIANTSDFDALDPKIKALFER